MGMNIFEASFTQLWMLVLKRCVYLVAKFISFKGMAFLVCCLFLCSGVISGAVWCSLILGIITNRTGKQIMSSLGKGENCGEKTDCDADSSMYDDCESSLPSAGKIVSGKAQSAAAGAKERIRNIIVHGKL